MLEALWTAEFASNLGVFGAGVVVFETGRLFGGDSQYYYLGTCEVKNDILDADIEVTHFAGQGFSLFGNLQKFHLKVSGKLQEPVMDVNGYLKENQNLKIHIRLTRRAELP